MANEQASVSETLRALNELRARLLFNAEFIEDVGICSNVSILSGGRGKHVLRAVFNYLGLDEGEPVPDYSWHQARDNLWQGAERYKRVYLIEACIAVLEGRLIIGDESFASHYKVYRLL